MSKINGIDVSEWELKGVLIPITECKYFEGIGDCKESKGLCVDNDNCYFKQLARLQEEKEKIKKQYNCYACDSCAGKEDYRNMKRHCENAIKTVHKHNNVLQEIREIAKNACKGCTSECDCIIDDEPCEYYGFYKIKELIDEVLNDRD